MLGGVAAVRLEFQLRTSRLIRAVQQAQLQDTSHRHGTTLSITFTRAKNELQLRVLEHSFTSADNRPSQCYTDRWLEAWNKQRSVGDSDEYNNERSSGTEPLIAMTKFVDLLIGQFALSHCQGIVGGLYPVKLAQWTF